MRKVLLGILFAALVSSCSTFRSSSSTSMNVNSTLHSATSTELWVSNEKISFTYRPKKADRKQGFKHILSNATAAALKEHGNADVLVERQYETTIKKRWFRRDKVHSITVTGYPATYKNFKVEPVK